MDKHDMPSLSFSGHRTSRKTHWSVHLIDHITKWVITIGGLGTILAVTTVCFFLLWVVIPLFQSPSVHEVNRFPNPLPVSTVPLLHLATDDSQRMGWALFQDGKLVVFRLDNGKIIDQVNVSPDRNITAVSFSPDGDSGILGFDDGTIQVGRFGVKSTFWEADEVPAEIQVDHVGDQTEWEKGIVVHFAEKQYRYHKFEYELRDPIEVSPHIPIRALDHTIGQSGIIFCALSDDDGLMLYSLREKKNLMTGKITFNPSSSKIPYSPPKDKEKPMYIKITGLGDGIYVIWKDGYTFRYNTHDLQKPLLAETLDLIEEPSATLTALRFLIGRNTLITGDSNGSIHGWFRIRSADAQTPDGMKLVKAHTLPSIQNPVTSFSASQRSRVIAAGYQNGNIRLFHVTSDQLLLEIPSSDREPVVTLALANKENGLFAITPKQGFQRSLDLKYPEATLAALFHPVWYEGFEKPAHIWQSSSGTDDFEPKYGLIPLIFGTAKATFYSMLFGVPLALLAAIYTSEFMHPRTKALVKPTVELMASLPSVVLGFLAALIFAPFVEKVLPTVLVGFLVVPITFAAGAILWQLLPYRWNLSLQKRRFLFILICLPIALFIANQMGSHAEQWFVQGNIMAWLNHQSGSGLTGWVFILIPICVFMTFMGMTIWVNPWIRSRMAGWNRNRLAWIEAIKFLFGGSITLGIAYILGSFLTDLGFDPRGVLIDTYDQRNAMIVGIVMGFAIIPIIYTIADDALSSVPEHLRSASLGCGATPWQTAIYVIIPTAMSGLFSAIMIGLGRAVGETMIVLMAAGNTPVLDMNIFNGFRTLSANIAVELPEAVRNSTHYRTLFLAALTLFIMTFILNTIAEMVRMRFRKRAFEL